MGNAIDLIVMRVRELFGYQTPIERFVPDDFFASGAGREAVFESGVRGNNAAARGIAVRRLNWE
jgi:hypothetical protein